MAAPFQVRSIGRGSVGNDTTLANTLDLKWSNSWCIKLNHVTTRYCELFFAWDHGYLRNPKYLFDANMRACIKKSSCLLHCNAGAIALIVSLPTLSLHYLQHCNGAGKGTITLKRLPLISWKSEYSMSGGGFVDWSKLAQSEITHNLESLIKCLTNEMFAHSAAISQV
jgi:hypothetical protein